MEQPAGFLAINKPSGPTSHDIVDLVRKATNQRTVGHAGTLDPLASGVLIVGIGRSATKQLSQWHRYSKTYIADIILGETSDTHDRTGQREKISARQPDLETVQQTLIGFIGEQEQIPPMHSAKKIAGQKLYRLARQGKTIKRLPSKITIYDLKLLDYRYPRLKLEITCSTGTYIRSLARDLGEKLGTGALLEELERTAIGTVTLADCLKVEELPKRWTTALFPLP